MQKPNLNPPIKSICTTTNAATDTNPVFIIETYRNGTEWYRKYSDGTIEQGGWCNNLAENATLTNNFVTPYTDASSVKLNFTLISTGYSGNGRGGLQISSNTTTTFSVHSDSYITNTGGYYWIARGI